MVALLDCAGINAIKVIETELPSTMYTFEWQQIICVGELTLPDFSDEQCFFFYLFGKPITATATLSANVICGMPSLG